MNGEPRMAVLALGTAALLLGACGDDGGVDREEVVDDLVEEGVSAEAAECLVDTVGADDLDRLRDEPVDEVSDEEAAEVESAFSDCVLGDLDLDMDLDEMDLDELDPDAGAATTDPGNGADG